MSPARSTGFASADAGDDFLRARRREALARLGRGMRRGGTDLGTILPFDEVVAALGRTGEQDLGVQSLAVESIVGTVDRAGGPFDRSFRPRSSAVRHRWERIAGMMRRGEALPPISAYRIGEVHFVRDGHHRVSVARGLGIERLDARVVEVRTRVGADRRITLADLPSKGHERLLHERVPVPEAVRERLGLRDPWRSGELAEGFEAWAFRTLLHRGGAPDRRELARAWFDEEFAPVVAMIDDAGLRRAGETDADAYVRVGGERYRVLQTHEWSPEVLERIPRPRGRHRAVPGARALPEPPAADAPPSTEG